MSRAAWLALWLTQGKGTGRIDLPAVDAAPSSPAGPGTRILFVNTSLWPLEVQWVDPRGQRRTYHTLAPGRQVEQTTYTGHVWVLVDPQGHDIRAVRAEPGLGRCVILGG